MREVTFKLYWFDELSEEAQQKALRNYPPEWYEGDCYGIVEEAQEYVAEMVNEDGFEDAEFYTCNHRYNTRWGLRCRLPVSKAIEMFGDKFTNYHPSTFIWIDYNGCGLSSDSDTEFSDDEQFNENVVSQIEDKMYDYCGILMSNIEDDYEYRNTDEWKKENYICNEIEFYEDGERYRRKD